MMFFMKISAYCFVRFFLQGRCLVRSACMTISSKQFFQASCVGFHGGFHGGASGSSRGGDAHVS